MISIEKKIMIIIVTLLLLLLLPLKRELASVLPRMAGDQEADSTPMKPQLDFKDAAFVGSNVSIAACPIQGMNFTSGIDDSSKANDNRVMPCIAKIESPLCHIDFWGSSRKLAFIFQDFCFSFWTSMISNTFLDLFFNQYLAPYEKSVA